VNVAVEAEPEPERVARTLLGLGSRRAGLALLRGVLAREPANEKCAALLESAQLGNIATSDTTPAPLLSFELVDRWLRRGMLVEALALLGGTSMGVDETGREWANLLGELLAPMPTEADLELLDVHRHLLTGGASVALVTLEDRARREPLPSWAQRRLELLRWMLLDNASAVAAYSLELGDAPDTLALAVRQALQTQNLDVLLEAARTWAAERPDDPRLHGVLHAVESIRATLAGAAGEGSRQDLTLPLSGHSFAAAQLAMGNIVVAAGAYAKLLEADEDDALARSMGGAVETLLRVARGQTLPASDDPWGDPTVRQEPSDALPDEDTRREPTGALLEAHESDRGGSPPSDEHRGDLSDERHRDLSGEHLGVLVQRIRPVR
jgi:hypothetical protein